MNKPLTPDKEDLVRDLILRARELHPSPVFQRLCGDEIFLRALTRSALMQFPGRSEQWFDAMAEGAPMVALLVMAYLED